MMRKLGRSVAFISFPKRVRYDIQLQDLHDRLSAEADAQSVITLRTNVSVPAKRAGMKVQRPRWFTVVDPDPELTARAKAFAYALEDIPNVRADLAT